MSIKSKRKPFPTLNGHAAQPPADQLAAVEPLADRVLIRRDESLVETAGGIVLPGTATKGQNRGTVVAVGPGRRLPDGQVVPVAVKPGDRVLFTGFAGQELDEPDGVTRSGGYVLLREDDVVARLPV